MSINDIEGLNDIEAVSSAGCLLSWLSACLSV